jgi:hypothetical protein
VHGRLVSSLAVDSLSGSSGAVLQVCCMELARLLRQGR